MNVLAGILGASLIVLMLAEFFVAFLLPRRVKRDPRIARWVLVMGWQGWRRVARRLPPASADTMLGFFGPLGLILTLALWTLGLVVGFAALQWATGSHLAPGRSLGFGDDLFFSGGGFLSASTDLGPADTTAKILFLLEAACGFGVLFIAIGYLPALFQAFSRREVAVSQLDPRAGSPPTAGGLLIRFGARGGWQGLNEYLAEWETWAAELMETHLSYPILSYFRSQHLNQNWLSSLTTVLDACAFTIAASPTEHTAESAEVTFAIGRHALADISFMFHANPLPPEPARLDDERLRKLCSRVREGGLDVMPESGFGSQLDDLRRQYEPYANALARRLELALPAWLPAPGAEANWRRSAWHHRAGALP